MIVLGCWGNSCREKKKKRRGSALDGSESNNKNTSSRWLLP